MTVVDLFAGAGGWDVGARALGLDPLGIEWDDAACATRTAAGLRTIQADVAHLRPADFAPCTGLIASPPCQAWSPAGKGGGRRDQQIVTSCAGDLAAGTDRRAERAAECEDSRSILVVEPLRWALELRPEWIAFEQVPPVLGLWSMFAQILTLNGYRTWAGVLEAERYGVPQTRERAILLASRVGPATPPRPTHQRYLPGEPQRHDITLEGETLPWVSMAEALGWADGEEPAPAPTVTSGGGATGGVEVFAGPGSRERASRAVQLRACVSGEGTRKASPRTPDEPAQTVTGRHRSAEWVPPTLVSGQSVAGGPKAERDANDPALTVTGRADLWKWRDDPPTHYDRRQGSTRTDGSRRMVRPIPVTDPAPTIGAMGLASGRDVWAYERPATTVNGDPRISQPGRHDPAVSGSQQEGAVRVTVEEAAALQTFPPGYPWQGSRTKQFEQIGNAVPPLLALHVLAAITGIAIPDQLAEAA